MLSVAACFRYDQVGGKDMFYMHISSGEVHAFEQRLDAWLQV